MRDFIRYLRRVIPHNSPLRLWYTRLQQIYARLLIPVDIKKIKLIGVTGTDGKTTTVEMLSHILKELNISYLSSSSIDVKIDESVISTSKRTTPSLWQLRRLLKQAINQKARVAVIEVSSHSLVQWRILGLKFDTAILTNITHEHLNYHKTLKRYANAKKLLFTKYLKKDGVAILPTEDKYGNKWLKEFTNAVAYNQPKATTSIEGTSFTYGNIAYSMPMLGTYNAGNAVASALAIHQTINNINVDKSLKALKNFDGILGRMQIIRESLNHNILAIVDFALTQRAMQSALNTARELAKNNQVIVVFGATGGQHDSSVHPGLAKAVAEGSDLAIVTDDEPYDGNPNKIRKNLIEYIKAAKNKGDYINIQDRREAIRYALSKASDGDVVVVAGMGHYTSRTVNGKEIPWNDAETIREELAKM